MTKLIEVALPLEAINTASAREKSIRHGHPSTLHLWWARRPLAACRAVLFASLVDDPSSDQERFPTLKAQEVERQRLFGIIEDLVLWENSTNERVLEAAHAEIRRSTGGSPPPVLDPFCGGGSIPLEAQRLGLRALASDLNPVAVLITKALIELPGRFRGLPPVHPDARRGVGSSGAWKGSGGLAEDVRRYGAWMHKEAERRIGHHYPTVQLTREHGGGEAKVIAWVWARTVTCPNPACGAALPLVHSFVLSSRAGKNAWIEPIVDRSNRSVRFTVGTGTSSAHEGTVGRTGARCLVCDAHVSLDYIRGEGRGQRLGSQLMAVIAEGRRGRAYLEANDEHLNAALIAPPAIYPMEEIAFNPRDIKAPTYGLSHFGDLFTSRQLVALTTFSDLIAEARALVQRDAQAASLAGDVGIPGDGANLDAGAYADSVATYLAFAVDKAANYWSSLCAWHSGREIIMSTFGRQALPMVWDYTEANPFSNSSGNFALGVSQAAEMLDALPAAGPVGEVKMQNAVDVKLDERVVVSTDPPYYANIIYADLADFFYVWLRRSLASVYPELFQTLVTPKTAELVATPYRFAGDRKAADRHFESGLGAAFARIRDVADPSIPVTIYYAFKQSETEADEGDGGLASTGWETMLEGLLSSGFAVVGTWPIRSELTVALKRNMSALSSSIVLVCRARASDAGVTDRRGFLAALTSELPTALRTLQHGNIAPVDLAQASIGPGMAVFSRYTRVIEPDGRAMPVRAALVMINHVLAQVLSEQEDEFDNDTRWAVTWFEQNGHRDGKFGDAEVLSKAKNTGVNALRVAGIISDGAGKVHLRRREDLDAGWDPSSDERVTVWEVTQYLIRALNEGGERAAADLVRRVGGLADTARDLAYRLYAICERQKWTDEALGYNALVAAWPEITRLAASDGGTDGPQQTQLFS